MSSTYAFPMRERQLQDRGLVTVGPGDVSIVNGATGILHTMTVPDSTSVWLTGMFVTAQPQNPPFDDVERNIFLWIAQGTQIVWPYTEGESAIYGTPARVNVQGLAARQTRGGVWIPVMLSLNGGTYTWNCLNNSLVPIHASIVLQLTQENLLTDGDLSPDGTRVLLEHAVTSPDFAANGPTSMPLVQDPIPGGPNQRNIPLSPPWTGDN